MGNLAKFLRGAVAAAAGGGGGVLQHWLTEGNFDLDRKHLQAACLGAAVALLFYFAKSPLHDAPQMGSDPKENGK